MVVRPGESIPADGRILTGDALVEESAFTGEAHPRSCSPGDQVYGGSTNRDGLITVEATAVGSDAVLAQIARMVRQAQRERAPVERLTEKASAVFVPVVWMAALGAAAYWGLAYGNVERAGLSAMAVLVVACPCALGLATPLATCIAIGKAASAGVLVRSGETLERLPQVSRMFFDKTGTLTMNRLVITDVLAARGTSAGEVLAWAGPLAAASEHSVARAIAEAAASHSAAGGSLRDFAAVPGFGVEGTVIMNGATRWVTLGSLKLVLRQHEVPADMRPSPDSEPLTAAYVGWDGRVQGAIHLSDEARPGAGAVIEQLKAMEVGPAVVSGDLDGPTRRLAAELGIAELFAECTPAEKVKIVREAQQPAGGVCAAPTRDVVKGARHANTVVAVVGDGINDAPALAQADVGLTIGGGTDLARQAGNVTLMGDDLARIPWLLELARLTHRVIRQNLWWAFGYNSAAIAVAFFGYIHPLIAALAMFVSSLSVIANSMRVSRFPMTQGVGRHGDRPVRDRLP